MVEDCQICLNTCIDCVRPCMRSEHTYCQECWDEWSNTFQDPLFPCPTCRGVAFHRDLASCNGFVISRNPLEGVDAEEGLSKVDLLSVQCINVHEAFLALRHSLLTHPHWVEGILLEEVTVSFISSESDHSYQLTRPVILYAARQEEDLDITTYYESIRSVDIDSYEYEEETEYLSTHDDYLIESSQNELDLIACMNQYTPY